MRERDKSNDVCMRVCGCVCVSVCVCVCVYIQAIEALDDEGERHALGNMICGALSPFLVNGYGNPKP
jgi:hypothetical protein